MDTFCIVVLFVIPAALIVGMAIGESVNKSREKKRGAL